MNYKKPILMTILFVLSVLSIFTQLLHVVSENNLELPSISSAVQPNPSINLGPGSAAIVFPGETITLILRQKYATSDICCGYIYSVVLDGEKLVLRNYSVDIVFINETHYNITIPAESEPGLYDLVLTGGVSYRIDRSIWIVREILDVLRIAHISDLHYGAGYPDPFVGNYKRATGLLLINMLNPDLIIHSGDDADTGAPIQYVYSRAFRYMFTYSIPMLFNTGNHDYQDLGNFLEYYGPFIWYRVYGDKVLFVSIDTRGEEAHPTLENVIWVGSILEKYKHIPIKIISMHHPVFYWQGELTLHYNHTIFYTDPRSVSDSPVGYYWGANLNTTRYFIKLCEDYNVSLVFAGHIHRDQYVKYNSNRTNTTTYFITTTTFAQSRPLYNGFQYIVVNLTQFNMSFPYAPPSFIGFRNYSRTSVRNSIYNEYDSRRNYGWFGKFISSKHAYVFEISNRQFNITSRVIISLPWRGEFKGLRYESYNNSSVQVVDYIVLDNMLYIALDINLPAGSDLLFILYNKEDINPPLIIYRLSIPDPPRLGRENRLYYDIIENEWGVKYIHAWLVFNNTNRTISIVYVSGNTYMVKVSGVTGLEPVNISIIIRVQDYADLVTIEYFNITLYPATARTQTTTPYTETVTKTPADTTEEIETTTITEYPTTTETVTVTSTTSESSVETERDFRVGTNIVLILVSIIIMLLILTIIVYFRKKS